MVNPIGQVGGPSRAAPAARSTFDRCTRDLGPGAWKPKREVAEILQAWTVPTTKTRSRQRAHVPAAAATLARRILLLLRDITPERKWTANDEDGTGLVVQGQRGFQRWQGTIGAAIPGVRYPRTPCKVFASHKQLDIKGDLFGLLAGRETYVIDKAGQVQMVFNC